MSALREALRPPKCTIYTGHTKGVWEINFSYGACVRHCPTACCSPPALTSRTPPLPSLPPPLPARWLADGSTFICASHDRLAILRESATGNWGTTLEGHQGAVWSSKLDRTGLLVATGAADCTARLWSLAYSEDGKISSEFKHELVHRQVVRTVEFSPVSGGGGCAQPRVRLGRAPGRGCPHCASACASPQALLLSHTHPHSGFWLLPLPPSLPPPLLPPSCRTAATCALGAMTASCASMTCRPWARSPWPQWSTPPPCPPQPPLPQQGASRRLCGLPAAAACTLGMMEALCAAGTWPACAARGS